VARGKRGHGRQSWRSCLRIADPWRSCLRIADPGRANEPASNARPLRTTLSRCRCLQRAVVTHVVVVGSCRGPLSGASPDFGLGLWPAHKPPSRQCQHQDCICNNNQQRAVVVGGVWHVGCCPRWCVFFNLNFDVAPLSLRLAKTDSSGHQVLPIYNQLK
jgi:hypothetical protein